MKTKFVEMNEREKMILLPGEKRFGSLIIALILAGCLMKCGLESGYKIPPEGWKIVVDERGNFGAQFPDSGYVLDTDYDSRKLKSRQQAIDRAWSHEEWCWRKKVEAGKKAECTEPPPNWKPAK